jgi:hypothetical protein
MTWRKPSRSSSRHSERLTIVFGMLNMSPETRLVVMKNLMVCGEAAGGEMWGQPPTGDPGIEARPPKWRNGGDGKWGTKSWVPRWGLGWLWERKKRAVMTTLVS